MNLRTAFIRIAHENPETRSTLLPLVKQADRWEKMPEGWTDESRKQFWETLTGDVKHKVTKCIKEMEGKFDDPGAFCASLADRVDPGWRSRTAMEHTSPEALKEYLKEHPNADPKNHTVKKAPEKAETSGDKSNKGEGGNSGGDKKYIVPLPPPAQQKKNKQIVSKFKELGLFDVGDDVPYEALENLSGSVSASVDVAYEATMFNLLNGHSPTNSMIGVFKKMVSHLPDEKKDALSRVLEDPQFKGVKDVSEGGPAKGKKWSKAVTDVADEYYLANDDAKQLREFREDKPERGKKISDQELMRRFMAKASPETKRRMREMSVADFKAMYNAIMDEEDAGAGGGKQASLRARVIRLAASRPELRAALLPLLK